MVLYNNTLAITKYNLLRLDWRHISTLISRPTAHFHLNNFEHPQNDATCNVSPRFKIVVFPLVSKFGFNPVSNTSHNSFFLIGYIYHGVVQFSRDFYRNVTLVEFNL